VKPRDETLAAVVDLIRRTPFVEGSDEMRLAELKAASSPRSHTTVAARWLQALALQDSRPLGDPETRIRLSLDDADDGQLPPMDELLNELTLTLERPGATAETLASILADIAAASILAGAEVDR
jgi:hypothetical protein